MYTSLTSFSRRCLTLLLLLAIGFGNLTPLITFAEEGAASEGGSAPESSAPESTSEPASSGTESEHTESETEESQEETPAPEEESAQTQEDTAPSDTETIPQDTQASDTGSSTPIEAPQTEESPTTTSSSTSDAVESASTTPVTEGGGSSNTSEEAPQDIASTTPEDVPGEILATSTEQTVDELLENIASSTDSASTTSVVFDDISATTTVEVPWATTTEASASSTASTTGPTIVSGTAVAVANILNIVNTTFVNSEGALLLSNFYDDVSGTIDFRNSLPFLAGFGCGTTPCVSGDQVQVQISNDAFINNAVVVVANSGGNEIAGADSAAIHTGDAYAGLNLINFANTSFVDSNYLVVTMNAFRDVLGDLVFPTLSNFFGGAYNTSTIALENDATVENTLDVAAGTGGNTITDAAGTIATGGSMSTGNVFNQLNASLVGDANVSLLFRVHGSWAGRITGAPSDLQRLYGPDGSLYLYRAAPGFSSGSGSSSITGSSTALIRNDATVAAFTGGNTITDAETALITTGDAYAGANVVNVANTSVIGRNWMLAVVNIFGDFEGDIAFGRPDLWVGARIEAPSSPENGDELTYVLSVINNGDAEAEDATLTERFDAAHVEILDASVAYTGGAESLSWELGTIPAGGAIEITYRARIRDTEPGTTISSESRVSSSVTDNNLDDNTDSVSLRVGDTSRRVVEEEEELLQEYSTELSVTRTSTSMDLGDGAFRATQKIVVRNEGEEIAQGVVLRDVIRSPEGTTLREEPWTIGVMQPNEEVTVTYDIDVSADMPAGVYGLATVLSARGMSTKTYNNGSITISEALTEAEAPTYAVTVDNETPPRDTPLAGTVLGAVLEAITPTAHAATSDTTGAPRMNFMFLIPLLLFALVPVGYYLGLKRTGFYE